MEEIDETLTFISIKVLGLWTSIHFSSSLIKFFLEGSYFTLLAIFIHSPFPIFYKPPMI